MDSTTYALPVTPKQIAYARSLALRNHTLLGRFSRTAGL